MHAVVWAIAVALIAVVGGIAAYSLAYEGNVAVYVKDAPGAWAHVYVTFSDVAIHESGKDNATACGTVGSYRFLYRSMFSE